MSDDSGNRIGWRLTGAPGQLDRNARDGRPLVCFRNDGRATQAVFERVNLPQSNSGATSEMFIGETWFRRNTPLTHGMDDVQNGFRRNRWCRLENEFDKRVLYTGEAATMIGLPFPFRHTEKPTDWTRVPGNGTRTLHAWPLPADVSNELTPPQSGTVLDGTRGASGALVRATRNVCER